MSHIRILSNARTLLGSAMLALLGLAAAPAQAQDCDRACMTGLIDQYITALVAHDATKLSLADKVKVTENGQDAKLGEGVWKTVTGKGQFRQDYLDTAKQVAASQFVVLEDKNNLLYSLLLHIQNKKVTGVETLVQRLTPESRFQPKELGKPVRGFPDPIPAGKKMTREGMVRTALLYPEGLRIGSFTDAGTPFAKEAYRVENGLILAGDGCGRGDCGLYAQNIMVHPGVIASVAAVDEENGVVLLWMNFGHTGDSYGVGNALVTYEAFKVWGGEIHSINAFFLGLPVATARYWPSTDKVYK